MLTSANNGNYLSIGELARLTGISTHTLRIWEKRYGSPTSKRLPSGHRRYPKDEIPRLRAIASALESGFRAGKVVTASMQELCDLLGWEPKDSTVTENNENITVPDFRENGLQEWLDAARDYDEDVLMQGFLNEWERRGALACITECAVPFIVEIGRAWENGDLSVPQEHFSTACLSGFLDSKWRELNRNKNRWAVILATSPEETHQLGLLMCAVVTSLTDARIVYLGLNTPREDLVETCRTLNPKLLCLSFSSCMDPQQSEDFLFTLKGELNPGIAIVAGGRGAPENIPGVYRITGFEEYHQWLKKINGSIHYKARS